MALASFAGAPCWLKIGFRIEAKSVSMSALASISETAPNAAGRSTLEISPIRIACLDESSIFSRRPTRPCVAVAFPICPRDFKAARYRLSSGVVSAIFNIAGTPSGTCQSPQTSTAACTLSGVSEPSNSTMVSLPEEGMTRRSLEARAICKTKVANSACDVPACSFANWMTEDSCCGFESDAASANMPLRRAGSTLPWRSRVSIGLTTSGASTARNA